MRDYLIFHLYGPMQSWGEIAVGEVRSSAAHPTKSAIIGLIAASLGFRRDAEHDKDHKELFESLCFAVRVDSPGTLLRDYHTIEPPDKPTRGNYLTRRSELADKGKPILSYRDYCCDALYTVALWAKKEYDLNRLSEAVCSPIFTLSLGRKSCPSALPLRPVVRRAASLIEALKTVDYPIELKLLLPKPGSRVKLYWEGEEPNLKAAHRNNRRDVPISRSRWQFADREELYNAISVPGGEEE